MFKFNNLTDFEKLLFADRYVKELLKVISKIKVQNGVLLSENDELRHALSIDNPSQSKIIQQRLEINRLKEKLNKLKLNYEKLNCKFIELKKQL